MKESIRIVLAFVVMLVGSVAQAEDPRHDELRQLRDSCFKAYEARDIEGILKLVDENVVVTWQNGEQNHGRAELKGFYDRMMKGDAAIVSDVKSELTVHQLATLYDPNTAVACGTLKDQFKLRSGLSFALNSQWSATLVKQGDQWKIASFHVSANLFDNPLLSTAKNSLWTGSAVAGIVGILIGYLFGRRRKVATA